MFDSAIVAEFILIPEQCMTALHWEVNGDDRSTQFSCDVSDG